MTSILSNIKIDSLSFSNNLPFVFQDVINKGGGLRMLTAKLSSNCLVDPTTYMSRQINTNTDMKKCQEKGITENLRISRAAGHLNANTRG
jgi:hypothetical protein